MHIDVWTGRVYRGLAELPEFAQPRHPDHNAAQSLQMPWMGLCLFVCLLEREREREREWVLCCENLYQRNEKDEETQFHSLTLTSVKPLECLCNTNS